MSPVSLGSTIDEDALKLPASASSPRVLSRFPLEPSIFL